MMQSADLENLLDSISTTITTYNFPFNYICNHLKLNNCNSISTIVSN